MSITARPCYWTALVSLAWVAVLGCQPATNHSDYRSIHEYARDGDLADVRAVLALNPTNLNLPDDAGLTPLDLAASYCHTNVVQFLLEKGATINATAKDGGTALHLAAQEGCADTVTLLLLKGAGVNPKDDQGRTPLKRAELWHQDATAAILRQHGGTD